jgi:hypothetical protein
LATVYLLSAGAPVSEVNLIEFLKEFYTPDKIIATADYLAAVQEVLKKIGDGYVPRDKNLCKNAYDARLPEILRIMSRGHCIYVWRFISYEAIHYNLTIGL